LALAHNTQFHRWASGKAMTPGFQLIPLFMWAILLAQPASRMTSRNRRRNNSSQRPCGGFNLWQPL